MKIGMMFPGYGSQFVGMGKELYDEYRIVQEFFEEASICLNINFVKLCFASSDVELSRASNAYTSIFILSSAIAALLKQEGITPTLVAGYNQGEYAALFAAGGITIPDGLYLLNKYAQLYQDAFIAQETAAIRVVGMPGQEIESICSRAMAWTKKHVHVAVYEPGDVYIVAGDIAAIEHVRTILAESTHLTLQNISTDLGLHSAMMDGVVEQLAMYLEKVDFKGLTIPLCEAQNGRLIEHSHEVREMILKQINHPIMWTQVVEALLTSDIIIEIGPGTMLTDMIKKQYPDKTVIAVNKRADIDELKKLVQTQPL